MAGVYRHMLPHCGAPTFIPIRGHEPGAAEALSDAEIPAGPGGHRHLSHAESEGVVADLAAKGWALVYLGEAPGAPARLLPTDGPERDLLIRLMRQAHLDADGTESRRGIDAAYDALAAWRAPNGKATDDAG